jgi:hypothetical protein
LPSGRGDGGDGGAFGSEKPEPAAAGDDEIEHCPGGGETARLAREPADDLGPAAYFLERALQQVGAAQSPPERERVGQMDSERDQVIGQTRRGRGVRAQELADERTEPSFQYAARTRWWSSGFLGSFARTLRSRWTVQR